MIRLRFKLAMWKLRVRYFTTIPLSPTEAHGSEQLAQSRYDGRESNSWSLDYVSGGLITTLPSHPEMNMSYILFIRSEVYFPVLLSDVRENTLNWASRLGGYCFLLLIYFSMKYCKIWQLFILISNKTNVCSDLPSLPHLAGDSRILEPSPAHRPHF